MGWRVWLSDRRDSSQALVDTCIGACAQTHTLQAEPDNTRHVGTLSHWAILPRRRIIGEKCFCQKWPFSQKRALVRKEL